MKKTITLPLLILLVSAFYVRAQPPVLPPPQGFNAVFIEDIGVECSWGMYTPNEYWLGYDDGENAGGMGASGGGTFYAAIRWDSLDLVPYNGMYLTAFKFFPRMVANPSDITFAIWEGSIAPSIVYEQDLLNLNWNEWNIIYIDEPYPITSEKDLWVGFMVTHPDGEDPIGCDSGPAISGYGDMISFDGTTWESLSAAYNMDFNYNLKILVEENPDSKNILSSGNPKSEFLGVNIYRDGNQVNGTTIEPGVEQYIDPFFEPGTWIYTAKAVYDEGLSDPTPEVEIIIPGQPGISVSPDSLTEVHETPPQVTTQELTITNTGDEPLEWEIDIDFGNKKSKSQKTETKECKKLLGGRLNNDVGIWSIVEPTSGANLGNEEPVTIKIQNYGDEIQTEIPWKVSYSGPTGSDTLSGTWIGNLASGGSVDVTLEETVDMSVFGEYEFEACTQLPGDELSDNDCKYKSVICIEPSLCSPDYSFGCGYGDGLISWDLANIQIPEIPCEGQPEYYHDYRDHIHQLTAGNSFELTVKAGYDDTYFIIWIDTDDDYDLYDEEPILSAAYCEFANIPYSFNIEISDDMPLGEHVLRYRTNWTTPMYDPCEAYSYGNCCDFTINVTDILNNAWFSVDTTNGVIAPGASQVVMVAFNSESLSAGTHNADILIGSNDPETPVVEVPVTLELMEEQSPLLIYETFEDYEAGEPLVQQAIAQGKEYWTTWSGSPGSTEDPFVSDFDAYEGFNAMVIEESNDAVLVLPENYTYGVFYVDFEVMVPAGKTGYFNCLQSFAGTSIEWGMQCFFDVDGAGSVDAGGEGSGSFTYEYDEWNHVHIMIDLDEDHAEMYFNDDLIVEWQWSTGSFGTGSLNAFHAMNFFAWSDNGTPGAFFDNIDISAPETNFLLPPNDLTGYIDWDGFGFQWLPPGGFEPQWITYSQEEITNSIGIDDEVNFDVAARFTPDFLNNFNNAEISKINFVPGEPGDICTYSLRVWQGSQPDPTLIYDEELTEVVSDVWNDIELANPVPFNNTEDLWIGFNCNTTSGFPAGCDDGPQDEGLGNMMFWDGEWVTLSSLNPDLTYNWALMAYVQSSRLNEPPTPLSITNTQQNSGGQFSFCPQLIDPPAVFSPDNVAATLLGYNLYKDGEILLEAYPETDYFDDDVYAGIMYEYYLTALYDEGESPPTQTLYLEIPDDIAEAEQQDIQLFPNPVGDELNIRAELEIQSITLYDVNGVKIFEDEKTEKYFQINASQFPPGIYTLQLETEKGMVVRKVVVQ